MGASIGVAAVVVVAALVATIGARHDSAPIISAPGPSRTTTPPARTDAESTVTVTAPDGSRYTLTGSKALALASLPVRFHAQISSAPDGLLPAFTAQPIIVQDVSVELWGTCKSGDVYGRWRVVLSCGPNEEIQRILTLLHPRVGADGFLVFAPEKPLILGPTDAPDVELGDGTIGVFGPSTYPAGCPTAANATGTTAHGDLAQVNDTGAWWCEPSDRVRIHVGDVALVADALRSLQVSRAPA